MKFSHKLYLLDSWSLCIFVIFTISNKCCEHKIVFCVLQSVNCMLSTEFSTGSCLWLTQLWLTVIIKHIDETGLEMPFLYINSASVFTRYEMLINSYDFK